MTANTIEFERLTQAESHLNRRESYVWINKNLIRTDDLRPQDREMVSNRSGEW